MVLRTGSLPTSVFAEACHVKRPQWLITVTEATLGTAWHTAQLFSARVRSLIEAARYLQLPAPTLETWRSRKRGPGYVKLGHSVRYRRSQLDAWLARNVVEVAA